MVRATVGRAPGDVKKTHNLGSLRLRHLDSNRIILVPTPTADPNGLLNPYLLSQRTKEAMLTHDFRSPELVQEIPLVHRYLSISGHLFLQFSRCRSFHCDRRNHIRIFRFPAGKQEFRIRYLQNRLLLHHDRLDARHGDFVLDAIDYQVWTQTYLCLIFRTLYRLCRLVRGFHNV